MEKFKILENVKLHIGNSCGKLQTLVQIQDSSVMTSLHLNIYAWVPSVAIWVRMTLSAK